MANEMTFGDQVRLNEMSDVIDRWRDASIHVKDGEAVVKGRVPSAEIMDRILEIVAKLPSVKIVNCHVEVVELQ